MKRRYTKFQQQFFKEGDVFGRWTVTSSQTVRKNCEKRGEETFVRVRCNCGNETERKASDIVRGNTGGCRCISTRTGPDSMSWKGCGQINAAYIAKIKYNAGKRGWDFTLSIQYLSSIFESQSRRCVLSGREIHFAKTKKDKGTASLDRIDSTVGYIEGNVQWVHKDVNYAKQRMPDIEFIQLCQEITNYQTEKKDGY